MTTELADALLVAVAGYGAKASARLPLQLPAPAGLAMLLAHEAGKGDASPWGPNIAALPERSPCAWLMDPKELRAALRPLLQQGRKLETLDDGGSTDWLHVLLLLLRGRVVAWTCCCLR